MAGLLLNSFASIEATALQEKSSHLRINASLCEVVIVDTCAVDAIPPEDGNQESFLCDEIGVSSASVKIELTQPVLQQAPYM